MRRLRHAVLIGCLAWAWPSPAAAAGRAGAPGAAVQLSAVQVSLDGPFVRITVRANAALPPATATPTTEGPPRIFIDLPGVDPGAVPATLTGRAIVRRVRVGLNSADPPVTRLVFDLAGAVTTALVAGGPELTVVIAPASDTTADASAPAVPPPPPPTRAAAVARPQPPPAAVSRPVLPPAAAAAPAPAPASPAAVAVPVSKTSTPAPASAATPAAATAPAKVPAAPPRTAQATGFGAARAVRPNGRVSIFSTGARASQMDAASTSYSDVTTAVTYELVERDSDGVEYGVDMRHTAYSIQGRDPRVSVYTGFVGARLAGGALRARAGHLWLDDLGGLGALAGAQLEARSAPIPEKGLGRWRGGLFAGLDPNVYKFGYSEGVKKAGAYMTLEGARGRRHVAGYVNVRNDAMTERSVLSVTNFVPAGPLFVYQAAEYDVAGAAGGVGHKGLTYFFGNARVNAGRRVELLGTLSRGRSVDTRGLSDDIQAGRAVTQQAIDGLQYQSLGGRATVEVLPRTRVYAGYSRDKNNRDDASTGRWLVGGFGGNVFDSGLDLTFSNSTMSRPTGSYHSTYVSAGHSLGRRVYATAEFSTALSRVRFTRSDGLVIETAPKTKRLGLSASAQLWRATSLLVSVERTMDDGYKEIRLLSGLTFRLR